MRFFPIPPMFFPVNRAGAVKARTLLSFFSQPHANLYFFPDGAFRPVSRPLGDMIDCIPVAELRFPNRLLL